MKSALPVVFGMVLMVSSGMHAAPPGPANTPVTAQAEESRPKLLLAYQPNYPRDFLLAGKAGSATVEFAVNSLGRVVSPRVVEASHPAFGKAVMSCILYWEYQPGKRQGKLAASKVRQKFTFKPSADSYFSAEFHDLAKRPIPVLPIVGPRPVYPESLRGEGLKGYADVIMTVSPLGKVTQTRLGEFNHKDFGQPALEAAGQWEFRPFDPTLRYEQETGTKPVFLSPTYGNYQVKLTLLFHPESTNKAPLDLRRVQ